MEEIKNRIEELEDRIFYLQMKDRWEKEDFELYDKLYEELNKLKGKVIK